jgi:hypothetical protein
MGARLRTVGARPQAREPVRRDTIAVGRRIQSPVDSTAFVPAVRVATVRCERRLACFTLDRKGPVRFIAEAAAPQPRRRNRGGWPAEQAGGMARRNYPDVLSRGFSVLKVTSPVPQNLSLGPRARPHARARARPSRPYARVSVKPGKAASRKGAGSGPLECSILTAAPPGRPAHGRSESFQIPQESAAPVQTGGAFVLSLAPSISIRRKFR